MTSSAVEQRWRRCVWILAAWVLFGLFFASQSAIAQAQAGRPVAWGRTLAAWMTCAGIWALLTPLVLGLARRFPFDRRRWARVLLVHLGASVALAVLSLGLFVLVHDLWEDPARPIVPSSYFRSLLAAELHSNWLVYWAIAGASWTIASYRRSRDSEVAAAELSAELARARLEALERQLHPHFLFNTLNSIAELMHRDVPAAERMLVRLSALLRAVLDRGASHEVQLEEELRFLASYLEIEQVRFQDRLRVALEIEPGTLQASVPRLLLQPLVENALRHGIAERAEEGGRVEVRASRINGSLKLQVSDNGPGLAAPERGPARNGIGLSTTRARLERHYGSSARLELCAAAGGGLEVTLTLPFRESGASDARAPRGRT
jgi:two-component system LytT family sensor kinase